VKLNRQVRSFQRDVHPGDIVEVFAGSVVVDLDVLEVELGRLLVLGEEANTAIVPRLRLGVRVRS